MLDTALRARVLANKHEIVCLKASKCSVDLLEIDMYFIPCRSPGWSWMVSWGTPPGCNPMTMMVGGGTESPQSQRWPPGAQY